MLVTARKFVELKAAPEDGEIEAPAPVDTLPRALQAPELVPPPRIPPEVVAQDAAGALVERATFSANPDKVPACGTTPRRIAAISAARP